MSRASEQHPAELQVSILSSHRLIFGPSWLQSRSPTWRETTKIRTNYRYEMLVFRAAPIQERVFQQSKMPPPRCEQEIMRMTRHGDGGYFRGGEERTGGGILQGKQLSRGEEAALI